MQGKKPHHRNPEYTDFNVYSYLQASYSDPRGPSPTFCPKMRRFIMTRIYHFYTETLPKQTKAAPKLLEFGGGPALASIISAVPYVDEIVFSDYLRCNLDAVEAWCNDLPTAYDWTPFFNYVLQDIEEKDDASGVHERALQLREKLSACEQGDANADQPIGSGYQAYFDVLSLSFCFESACRTHAHVVKALLALSQYLKSGSWIRINGVLETTIRDSLDKAGFININIESLDNIDMPHNADYRGMYHAIAQLR